MTTKTTTRRGAASKTASTTRKLPVTRTRKTTAAAKPQTVAKATVTKTAVTKSAEALENTSDASANEVVELPLPAEGRLGMKKKELVEKVVARSGVKKRDAKPAVEAALAILGEALSEGRELNLTPFGKLKVTRMKRGNNGQIIHARVRQPEEPENSLPHPLAHAAE